MKTVEKVFLLITLSTLLVHSSEGILSGAVEDITEFLEEQQNKLEALTEVFRQQNESQQLQIEKQQQQIELLQEQINAQKRTAHLHVLLNGTLPTADYLEKEEENEAVSFLSQMCIHGVSGFTGKDGRDGRDGNDGANGRDGRDGLPGIPGLTGLRGPKGAPGAPGNVAHVEGGAVYVRWGRKSCGSQSTLLYAGFAGGEYYTNTGGGVNYQCMPFDPQYNKAYTGASFKGSSINGAEYQTEHYGIFPNTAVQQNVPCARCYTENRPALMMIPAKRSCPTGWTREYEGYLMTQRYDHPHPTTYECVDQDPEYVNGMGGNANGALFYFVRTVCSGDGTTGQCPPYHDMKQLTCVVCSK